MDDFSPFEAAGTPTSSLPSGSPYVVPAPPVRHNVPAPPRGTPSPALSKRSARRGPAPPPPSERKRRAAPHPHRAASREAASSVSAPSSTALLQEAGALLQRMRDKLNVDAALLSKTYSSVARAVAAACTDTPPQFAMARSLLVDAEEGVSASGVLGLTVPDEERLYARAGYLAACAVFCRHAGSMEEAARYCAESLTLYEANPQASVTDVAAARLNSAAALGKLGRHDAAAVHAQDAVDTLHNTPGTGAMLAVAYYNLAVELHHSGRSAASRTAIDAAQQFSSQHLYPTDPAAHAISDMQRNTVYKLPKTVVDVKSLGRRPSLPAALHEKEGEREEAAAGSRAMQPAAPLSECGRSDGASFLPPITPSRQSVSGTSSDTWRREGSSIAGSANDVKKRSRDGQLGARNVAMSKRQYSQSFKKVAKHLSSLAVGVDRLKVKRERAAVQIQCLVRRCLARLELYNRRQLLYQIFHDKQCYVSNLVKGRNKSRRAKKWLDDRRQDVLRCNDERVEREIRQDRAACVIARSWRNYYQKSNAAMQNRVFEQALLETRMLKMSTECIWLQRWWRWVRLRKRHWRKRGEIIAAEMAQQRVHDNRVCSAVVIQSSWRMVRVQREVVDLRSRLAFAHTKRLADAPYAIEIVKYVLRSVIIRKKWRDVRKPTENDVRENGINIISRVSDGYRARCGLAEARRGRLLACGAAPIIQNAYRCHRARKTVKVQRLFREVFLYNRREQEVKEERSAYRIQRLYRQHRKELHVKDQMAARGRDLIRAVWCLQRSWRVVLAKKERIRRRHQHDAAFTERMLHASKEAEEREEVVQRIREQDLSERKAAADRVEHLKCREEAVNMARTELKQYDVSLILQQCGRGMLGRITLAAKHAVCSNAAVRIQLMYRSATARTVLDAKKVRFRELSEHARFVADLSHAMFCHHSTDLAAVECTERTFIVEQETQLFASLGDCDDLHSESGCYD